MVADASMAREESDDDGAEKPVVEVCITAYSYRKVLSTDTSSWRCSRSCGMGYELHEHNWSRGPGSQHREAAESSWRHGAEAMGRKGHKMEARDAKLERMDE